MYVSISIYIYMLYVYMYIYIYIYIFNFCTRFNLGSFKSLLFVAVYIDCFK